MKRSAWSRYVDRRAQIDQLPMPAKELAFEEADDLAQAILSLPPKYKEVILLYYYQDMTFREIASVLDVSISTVGKRLKAAYSKLKKMLGKEDFYES